MIRLNVSMIIEEESKRAPLLETAKELVAYSLRDKGCVDYDIYQSATNDDRYMIIETWENHHDLEKHKNSEHFKRLVPKLEDLATLTLEEFTF